MPLAVQCPTCSRELTVPDRLLGRKVKCPKCETMFRAGDAAEPIPLPPSAVVRTDTLTVACPTCSRPLGVPARLVGKTVQCAQCSTQFVASPPSENGGSETFRLTEVPVPLPPPAMPEEAVSEDEAGFGSSPASPGKKKKKRQPLQEAAPADFKPYLLGGGLAVVVFVVGLLAWLFWPRVDPEQWEVFASKEGNFGIKMPAKPQGLQYKVALPNAGEAVFNILLAEEDEQEFVAAYADLPDAPGDDRALLERVYHCQLADLYRQRAMLTTKNSRPMDFRGYPGKEYTVGVRFAGEEADSTAICRVYVVKKRVYLLFVASYAELSPEDAGVSGYFNTFDFMDDPPDIAKGKKPPGNNNPPPAKDDDGQDK